MSLRIEEISNRYLNDIRQIIIERSKTVEPKRILALSGGTDSILLLATVRSIWPDDVIHTFTIAGDRTPDLENAEYAANFFGAHHKTIPITLNMLFDNLSRIANTGYEKISEAMYHIFFDLAFESIDVSKSDFFSGEGADTLYGTWPKIYKKAQFVAETENCTLDEARVLLRQRYYENNKGKGCKKILIKLLQKFSANPIMPYTDERLLYINRLDYEISNPSSNKLFVKQAMQARFDWDIYKAARIGMQKGTGLREKFEDRLMVEYPHLGKTPEEIVCNYCAVS
jgi:asparagine synthetase B (glutamine-hydrolysing)